MPLTKSYLLQKFVTSLIKGLCSLKTTTTWTRSMTEQVKETLNGSINSIWRFPGGKRSSFLFLTCWSLCIDYIKPYKDLSALFKLFIGIKAEDKKRQTFRLSAFISVAVLCLSLVITNDIHQLIIVNQSTDSTYKSRVK